MNTIAFDDQAENWDAAHEDETVDEYHVPVRPRRKFLNGKTAALIAVITAAAGFYGGVRVEKGQVSSSSGGGLSSSAASRFSALAARFSGGSAAAGSGSGTSAGASASRASASGFPSGAAGFPGSAGGGSAGTVSTVNGNTVYVKTTSGNTIKVKLSSATKLTKTEKVGKAKINPGDTVTVSGLTKSGGTLVATSVSDSGDSSTAAASSSSSTTSGGSGGVSSLFQAGG